MQQGQIGTGCFIYRTTATVISIVSAMYVDAISGAPYGAGWGAFVAFVFAGGEVAYEVVTNLIDEFTKGIAEAEQALRSGIWIPGY